MVRIRIQKSSIHQFTEQILDEQGKPTGVTKEVLQADVSFPDFPDTPTYSVRIDLPLDKTKIFDELKNLALKAKEQHDKDMSIRQTVEDMGYLSFMVEI